MTRQQAIAEAQEIANSRKCKVFLFEEDDSTFGWMLAEAIVYFPYTKVLETIYPKGTSCPSS